MNELLKSLRLAVQQAVQDMCMEFEWQFCDFVGLPLVRKMWLIDSIISYPSICQCSIIPFSEHLHGLWYNMVMKHFLSGLSK